MGGYETLVMAGMNMIKARQQTKYQNAAIVAQQQRQTQRLEHAQSLRERQQREQLRRDQASRRARFGAAGVSSAGGSSQALLNGLAEEAEENIRNMRTSNQFQLDDLGRTATKRRRANLLEFKNQAINTGVGTFGRLTNLLEK